ncbi:MAG: hypothetical protein HUU57_14075 [Bdellovibrio sp.]|nr:hypothetical protein [Bdellovibrio sp.]
MKKNLIRGLLSSLLLVSSLAHGASEPKEISLSKAGYGNRGKLLIQTQFTEEALCTFARLYENYQLLFFCDELYTMPDGSRQPYRFYYKMPIKSLNVEVLELNGLKKGQAVEVLSKVGEAEAGSHWQIRHIFPNGRALIEPTYASVIRPFVNYITTIRTDIGNLKAAPAITAESENLYSN